MRWQDLSMMKKLSIGFSFVVLLLIIISTMSWSGFRTLSVEINQAVYFNKLAGIMLEREIDHMNWQSKVLIYLLDDGTEPLKVTTDDHACKLGKWLYGEGRKKAEAALPELAPLIKQLEAPHKDLHDSAKEMQQSVTANDGDRTAAKEIYNTKVRKSLQRVKAGVQGIAERIAEHVSESNHQLIADVALKNRMIILFTMGAIVLALLFSFLLARMITSTLNRAVSFAGRLADGDLTGRLQLEQKDELGQLATALDSMADGFNSMIGSMNNEVHDLASTANELNFISQAMATKSGNVSERAHSVAAATDELSGNMNSVAAASEEASTNVNIVATASEEVASSIAEVDAKTKEARNITEDAVHLADSSSEKVDALGLAFYLAVFLLYMLAEYLSP